MTVILVVADSHGNTVKLDAIVRAAGPVDCVIHCGDGVRDLENLTLPANVARVRVSGNVDLWQVHGMDRVTVEVIAGRRFMVTHGDLYGVSHDLDDVYRAGREARVEAVFFGHTHVALYRPGVPILFNPGPAQKGCYGIVECGAECRYRLERVPD